MSTKKMEEVVARDLGEALKRELKALTDAYYLEGVDASGNPTITFGTQATTSQCGYIKVKGEAIGGYDSLGLAQRVYQPHVIQVCVEESASAGISFFTAANLAKLLAIVSKVGAKVELFLSDTTVVPVDAQLTAANLVASIWPDTYNKMKNAI